MAYEPLTPLPFLPIPGLFNLNTFIPGSSDYEIMARVVETYNHAVELFNQIIAQYSDIDKTIEELTKEYQKQLDAYKEDTDTSISAFEQNINAKTQAQDTKIAAQDNKIDELAATVVKLQKDVDNLINGEYIDNYVKALATWIDNNLQQMVQKIVKYVWFELDESGYFIAYIPDTWDFVNFGTELDPDNEDYGKLVLEWESAVVQ